MMSRTQLDDFMRLLKASPAGPVFNPWWQTDQENDIGPYSPAIRRRHLASYFCERLGKARLAIIGEAPGYRGGHFSGIAMTSERILLGNKPEIVAALSQRQSPLQILPSIKPRRTSKPNTCPYGFSEPTATIVWGALLKTGLAPNQFVLWNAFPWHSFDPNRGLLSNRTPNKWEQLSGRPVLEAFLKLFPCKRIVALGKIAAGQLEQLDRYAHCVRHPASGGASLFREQIAKIAER